MAAHAHLSGDRTNTWAILIVGTQRLGELHQFFPLLL
jgi:hypothetical protein